MFKIQLTTVRSNTEWQLISNTCFSLLLCNNVCMILAVILDLQYTHLNSCNAATPIKADDACVQRAVYFVQ